MFVQNLDMIPWILVKCCLFKALQRCNNTFISIKYHPLEAALCLIIKINLNDHQQMMPPDCPRRRIGCCRCIFVSKNPRRPKQEVSWLPANKRATLPDKTMSKLVGRQICRFVPIKMSHRWHPHSPRTSLPSGRSKQRMAVSSLNFSSSPIHSVTIQQIWNKWLLQWQIMT